jgi:peptidoglycan/LPS O-acetylase OafA/YrhL
MIKNHPNIQIERRLEFVDALRGLSAMAVFVSHASERLDAGLREIIHTHFDLGHFGVILFFLCSGFVIPMSLERQGSLRRFWIRRVCRLYPLYWSTILISVTLAYMVSKYPSPLPFLAAHGHVILANLTMLELFLGYPYLRGEYWTLMFEMLFYGVVTLLVFTKLIRRTVVFTVGLMLAAIVVEGLLPLMYGVQIASGMISFLAIMFLGTVCYRLHCRDISARAGIAMLGLALVMIVITTLPDLLHASDRGLHTQAMSARIGAIVVFGMALLLRVARLPRPVLFLGMLSYSLYLMQGYVLLLNIGNIFANAALWLLSLLMLATATYYLVERPGMLMGARLTRPRTANNPQ